MNEPDFADFAGVREAVESALLSAFEAQKADDMELHEESINWGDLHCVRVERWVGRS